MKYHGNYVGGFREVFEFGKTLKRFGQPTIADELPAKKIGNLMLLGGSSISFINKKL